MRLAHYLDEAAVTEPEPEVEAAPGDGDDGGALITPPDPLEWAYMYRRIDNKPFSLEYDPKANRGYKPLEQIFRDNHPNIAIKKPAQKGVSELAITLACHTLDVGAKYYGLDKSGLNVGYVFSTREALSSFSKERFSGLLSETDKLASLFTVYNAVMFKQAGESYIYFAGGKSTKGMKSFAADKLILDEYDEILKKIVTLAEKRLKNSDLRHRLTLSTPTFPNKGIDELYQESDQKVWEVKCGRCVSWNELDFWRDVYADGKPYDLWQEWDKERLTSARMHAACPSCREEIHTFGEGRWTPRRPGVKRISGYYVPPLSCGKVDLNELAVNAVSTEPEEVQEFHNSDLGLAYEPQGARVTDSMLKQLGHTLKNGLLPDGPWRNTTMGVDQGAIFRYRISSTGPDGLRYVRVMGSLRQERGKSVWKKLSDLMAEYRVRLCVIDKDPELNACAEWADRHEGRVLRAYYPTGALALKGRMFRLPSEEPEDADVSQKQEANVVQVNRTMAMDAVFNVIATAAEVWPAKVHNDADVIAHMKAPIRVIVKDKEGQERATWVHTQRDDFFHTCVYDLIAQAALPKGVKGALGLGKVKDRWGGGDNE